MNDDVKGRLRIPSLINHDEYRAHITGFNIFFGALLGVVMAGSETLHSRDFTILLLYSAGMVTTILCITASRHRLLYAVLALVLAWLMPTLLTLLLSPKAALPEKLQPTLLVWAAVMIAIEFLPRKPAPEDHRTPAAAGE